MIVFRFKELLKKNNMSRYKFQQITQWNYKRINSYYFGTAKVISIAEIETICKMFNCEITDLIELKK